MDPDVQAILVEMALAADPEEVQALRPRLIQAIDRRLAVLAASTTVDEQHCLSCGYYNPFWRVRGLDLAVFLRAAHCVDPHPYICPCCCGCCLCGGQRPPFNPYFRCEVQAGIWHLAREALLATGWPTEQRPIPDDWQPAPLPWRRPPPPRSPLRGNIFDYLRRVDLSAYAGRFTPLTRVRPDRWKGRCPLHEERTASFYVYSTPWRWRCYGACATGGDIVALAKGLRRLGKR